MKRFQTVDDFMEAQDKYRSELTVLRDILLESSLDETVKWGFPVYTYKGKNLVGMSSFKAYFGLWFYQGALLNDQKGVLINAQEGKTKAMRQWRMQSMDDIDISVIKEYISESKKLQDQGIQIKPEKAKKLVIPEELQTKLDEDQSLRNNFFSLTPYKQRDFADYISSAKREATRISRLEKCIPIILAGKGLNDKYATKK